GGAGGGGGGGGGAVVASYTGAPTNIDGAHIFSNGGLGGAGSLGVLDDGVFSGDGLGGGVGEPGFAVFLAV
ncbi:MAG TPA: hypothetical protein VFH61_09345, partial [Thermoleophilia bacterium]|nr:hypothetical protein [Thermoleophilia bacterium]